MPSLGRLTFTIEPEGDASASDGVRLDTFIGALDNLRRILSRYDRNTTDQNKPSIAYDVVALSLNSPATVILEPKAINPAFDARDRIIDGFMREAQLLAEGGSILPHFNRPVLEMLRDTAEQARRQAVRLNLTTKSYQLVFDQSLEKRIERILSQEEGVFSSIEGVLERVNFHANANVCTIFPVYGPDRVTCHFASDLRNKVNDAVLRHVRVSGMVWSDRHNGLPHRVDMEEIEVLVDDKDQPSLSELRGIGRNFIESRSSEDFIRESRNGWT